MRYAGIWRAYSLPVVRRGAAGRAGGKQAVSGYDHPVPRKKKKQSACIVLTVAVISLCVFLNIATYAAAPVSWSLIVSAPLLYTWLLVKNTILSKQGRGARALFHLMGMSAMFLVFRYNDGFLEMVCQFPDTVHNTYNNTGADYSNAEVGI
jgi:hypothetical protein